MSQTSSNLPRLDAIATALRKTTEILACEIASPGKGAPSWSEFEWRIARAATAMQGVASLLLNTSCWSGPKDWREFLVDQRNHIAGRHRRIVHLLNRIDLAAGSEGIPILPLKGAALHSIGIYQSGDRPMADIDLLVREENIEATARLLCDFGFELTFSTWRHQLFESQSKKEPVGEFGEHIHNPIKIEVHTTIRERLPVSEIDITEFMFPRIARPGLNDYRSTRSLMMHLLLHAAGNMRAHALRQIQLHDIALLSERFTVSDWEELLFVHPRGQSLWWAMAPLMLTSRYYQSVIPRPIAAKIEAACPWLLRRKVRWQNLSDVSWSNLKVYAFPGIEWSTSPSEAINFIVSRIWPSSETREELRRFAAHNAGASEIPWYGVSQSARIVRWAFSRPARVQTLLAVRAALDQSE
jgi:hypothetical protein